jgi:hypothetical protein
VSDAAPVRPYPLSLYDGDLVNRLFERLGLGPRKVLHLLGRIGVVFAITWPPIAIIAVCEGLYSARIEETNFFADFAAYAQMFIGLPLFIVGEAIVGRATREAGDQFANSSIIRNPRHLHALERLHHRVAQLRDSWKGEVVGIALAYLVSAATIGSELMYHDKPTWHAEENGHLTWAGWWTFAITLPLLNYWWLRHIGRILLWCRYLYDVSRLRLDLIATHPDRTGGIGFISEVQGHWAWIIFAYGVTNIAAPVGYELVVLKFDWTVPSVWSPVLYFVLAAPALFTTPLFFFTRQLAITKLGARKRYRKLIMEHARVIEAHVLPQPKRKAPPALAATDVSLMAQMSQLFDRIEHMRVVPFDFRSMAQLVSATLGSVASVLPFLHLEGPAQKVLQMIVKILGVVSTSR